jgi:hypothetical protein
VNLNRILVWKQKVFSPNLATSVSGKFLEDGLARSKHKSLLAEGWLLINNLANVNYWNPMLTNLNKLENDFETKDGLDRTEVYIHIYVYLDSVSAVTDPCSRGPGFDSTH